MCPTCGSPVIAKCGEQNAHHWAHETLEECDTWSENVGPWHLSWQELVAEQYVEVTIGPHRADIVGNSRLVVELQHSPLAPAEIEAREQFYGSMIWLFDATGRFPCVPSGDRVFFSFGGTKHIEVCKGPVFLDCGSYIVEVEGFAGTFEKFSGFGRLRDRRWFASRFLSEVMKIGLPSPRELQDLPRADEWRGKQPWRLTETASSWRSPETGSEFVVPARTPYLPLNYKWRSSAGDVWADVIGRHPGIANGWTEAEFVDMKHLLSAAPMVLEGRLRLMPASLERMQVDCSAATIRRWVANADAHIQAGRIPVLKPYTLQSLIARAEKRDIERYGPRIPRSRRRMHSGNSSRSASFPCWNWAAALVNSRRIVNRETQRVWGRDFGVRAGP